MFAIGYFFNCEIACFFTSINGTSNLLKMILQFVLQEENIYSDSIDD